MLMFDKQSKIKKEIDAKAEKRKPNCDKNGATVINMIVKNDDGFLSEFSKHETPIISNSVADFLEDSTQSMLPNEKLTLNIESDCIDDEEKIVYRKAIKEYYTERYLGNERELRRNWLLAGFLAFFGVLILAVAIILGNHFEHLLWSEVVDIVAWVFLWEAVDISFFHCHDLRVKRRRYLSFISMTVNYTSLKYNIEEVVRF